MNSLLDFLNNCQQYKKYYTLYKYIIISTKLKNKQYLNESQDDTGIHNLD